MNPFTSLRNIAAMVLISVAAQAQQTGTTSTASADVPSANSFVANDAATLDGLKLRNAKLFDRFTSQFRNATDISVFPEGKSTIVYCKVDGIRNNILFSANGRLIHTVRYYTPELLPAPVAKMIEDEFQGYEMKYVSEVTTNGLTAYLVNIENKRGYKTIRVVDGNLDIYNEFDKQK